jgi:putative two-component system response regulator
MSTPEQNAQDDRALIMVVDDNPEFLSGIELTLEMEGYKVWTVMNGQEALDQLKAAFMGEGDAGAGATRLPDLILADIMMPVMDGYELYQEMRANPYLNHIPFVFLTAKSGDVDIRHGKELGADDYLTKLASTEDMLATVRGKLKRAEQQRTLAAQFTGDLGGPLEGGRVLLLVLVVALVTIGCVVGIIIANGLFS